MNYVSCFLIRAAATSTRIWACFSNCRAQMRAVTCISRDFSSRVRNARFRDCRISAAAAYRARVAFTNAFTAAGDELEIAPVSRRDCDPSSAFCQRKRGLIEATSTTSPRLPAVRSRTAVNTSELDRQADRKPDEAASTTATPRAIS